MGYIMNAASRHKDKDAAPYQKGRLHVCYISQRHYGTSLEALRSETNASETRSGTDMDASSST